MDINELFEKAKAQTEKIKPNTRFVVKDLFLATEWSDIPRGVRINLGKHFKNQVINDKVPNIKYVGKSQNNSSTYEKY